MLRGLAEYKFVEIDKTTRHETKTVRHPNLRD